MRAMLARTPAAAFMLVFFATTALAHGGEDHAPPPPVASAEAGARVAEAATAQFEAVLKYSAAEVSEPLSIRLYLSDYATNAPIANASVILSIPELKLDVTASPTPAAGVLEFILSPGKAGTFSAIAAVNAGERSDLLVFDAIEFGPEAAAPSPAGSGKTLGMVGGAVAVALLAFALGRASSRRVASGGAMGAAVLLMVVASARAHGGEDHGAPAGAKTAGPAEIAIVSKEAQFTFEIRTVLAREVTLPGRRALRGTVIARPDGKAVIVAPESGRVLAAGSAMPRIGDVVRKGQPLVVIEGFMNPQERVASRSALVEAEAHRVAAAEELAVAERQARRAESLPEIFSLREREEAAARFATARAADEAARRNVSVLRAAVEGGQGSATRHVLAAPIDGVIQSGIVTAGEAVDVGAHLLTVLEASSMWIRVDLPEGEAGTLRLAAGAEALATSPASRTPVVATFVSAASSVDPATRTVAAYFETSASGGRLLEGQLVDVLVPTGAARRGFVIPASAVVNVSGKTVVFAHVHAEEFAPRDVELGVATGDVVEVLSGLRGGDRVVTSGAFQVRAALLAGN